MATTPLPPRPLGPAPVLSRDPVVAAWYAAHPEFVPGGLVLMWADTPQVTWHRVHGYGRGGYVALSPVALDDRGDWPYSTYYRPEDVTLTGLAVRPYPTEGSGS